jgi:hypothetical protein
VAIAEVVRVITPAGEAFKPAWKITGWVKRPVELGGKK